jgi:hypothetical protein
MTTSSLPFKYEATPRTFDWSGMGTANVGIWTFKLKVYFNELHTTNETLAQLMTIDIR